MTTDWDNLPDDTLVCTEGTGWIGEVTGNTLYAICGGAANGHRVYIPSVPISYKQGVEDILRGWVDHPPFGQLIVALPGTPEWDELNARVMRAVLERAQ